jgi:L,D-transpeptidase YcbB
MINNHAMRNTVLSIVGIILGIWFASFYRYKETHLTAKEIHAPTTLQKNNSPLTEIYIDSITIAHFIKKYPNFKKYQLDLYVLYKNRKYHSIWIHENRLIDFARLLYSKVNLLEEEGLKCSFPYKPIIDAIFNTTLGSESPQIDTEIMLSLLYLFYAQKVYYGIETQKIKEIGWFIARKSISYGAVLDSLIANPELLNRNEKQLFGQYYKLRTVLKKYREIAKNGDWNLIQTAIPDQSYKPDDSSKTIGQIRHRLYITGDLQQDSKSNLYDTELMAGILNYKKRNGFKLNYLITPIHIEQMNIPIQERIKTIILNMERCRWIPPELTKANEHIIINIPSFTLFFKRNGKIELESSVFVGKIMTETVVFSANMTQIVFSPYWYLPQSIIKYELKLEMNRDKDYLALHDIEWNGGNVRQKPGPKNSLGLIKFVFPNSNNIYLHDTPAKSLFEFESRAFSHGCINVSKAKELALLILKDDPDWPLARIDEAMKGGKEITCNLKKKIPVHIGYFTTWVNDSGEINFYNDIYERDPILAKMLFSDSK